LYKIFKKLKLVVGSWSSESPTRIPAVIIMTATQARDCLPEALNQVTYGGERIIIKRHGKVVGALISERDLALLETLENRYWAETAREALAEMKDSGETPIPWEQVKAELGL
jgi:PHD/YefM family antitoxin component YafN of YafNO toxin-antitoxin module